MIILDTHALVWVVQDDSRLGPRARSAIEQAAQEDLVRVPVIVCWEIGMLAAKDRLALNGDVALWVSEALTLSGLRLAPLTPEIAVDSTRLPGQAHGDPADRMIVATARRLGGTLVTADGKLLAYARSGHVLGLDAAS